MQQLDYEKLADLIVEKLLQKQAEMEREAEQTEHQLAELSRLDTLISLYEQQEKYEKAAIIMRKYERLKQRLIKKGVL